MFSSGVFRSTVSLVLCTQLVASSPLCMAAGDITFKRMEDYLQLHSIDGDFSETKYQKMITLFKQSIQMITEPEKTIDEPETLFRRRKLASCGTLLPKAICEFVIGDQRLKTMDEDDQEDALPFLKFGVERLEQASTLADKKHGFYIAKNILYSIFAGSYEGRSLSWSEIAQFPFRRLKAKIRYLSPEERHQVLPEKKVAKEAAFLSGPGAQDLSKLTPAQIAQLDVRADDPLWYQRTHIEGRSHELWKELVDRYERQTQARVNKKQERTDLTYRFTDARRVVMFNKFKDKGGSHPKIFVKDPLGGSWKLKWGNEVYSETVANRLYIALGGKHQDLTFSHTAVNPVLVIFNKPTDAPSDDNICKSITDWTSLNKCVKQSKYAADLSPFLHAQGAGKITRSNLPTIKKLLSSSARKLVKDSDLLGAHYAYVMGGSMEYKGNGIYHRSGPMAQSTLGSENNRAMRGLGLFYMFLDNFDAKDANGESVLVQDDQGKWQYVQAPVDLGGAIRGFRLRKRGLNAFATESFMRYSKHRRHRVVYTVPSLYRPRAVDKATCADLLWMAEKIAKLPASVIGQAVAASNMPDFFQSVLRYKLMKRRNRIATLYNLEELLDVSDDQLELPTLMIELTTEEQRHNIAKQYGLSEELLEDAMAYYSLLNKRYFEHVVENGELVDCHNSLLINLLEGTLYPNGLARDIDDRSQRPGKCKFHPRYR